MTVGLRIVYKRGNKMFLAKDKNNQWIHAHDADMTQTPYTCPECLREVYIKKGAYKTTHFAHFKKCAQQRFSEGETIEHLAGKQLLYERLLTHQEDVVLEPYLPDLKQRPDLLWRKDGQIIALEFQCSPISPKRLTERTQGYTRHGIRVIWIVGRKHHLQKNTVFLYCEKLPYYVYLDVGTNTLYSVTQYGMEKMDVLDIVTAPIKDIYTISRTRERRVSQTFLKKVYPLRLPIHLVPVCLYRYTARPFGLKNRFSECLILIYCTLQQQKCSTERLYHVLEKWERLSVVERKETPLIEQACYLEFLLRMCLHILQEEGCIRWMRGTDTWEILNNND